MDFYTLCTLLLVLLITWMLAIYIKMMFQKSKLPPGPTPLPIIGTLHKLNMNNITQSLMQLSKTYGDMFTIFEGSRPCVVLCGYKAVKETLIDKAEEFSGRAYYPVFYDFTKGNEMAFSNGEKWKELRRFSMLTLTNFGMGKHSIEERMKEDIVYLIEIFRKSNGSPIVPKNDIHCSVLNIICSIMFGKRFDYEDKEFKNLMHLLHDCFKIISNPWGLMYNIYPGLLKYIPGPHKQLMKKYQLIIDFIQKRVDKNIKNLDSNNPNDFIDCFLIQMEKERKNSVSYYDKNTLMMNIMVLIFGATEAISNTLCFVILILMKYPNIAEKVYQEIDNVIGQRSPNYEDRFKMPYTEAFIHEVQRYADVAPLNPSHELTKDTQIRNYRFRKGTVFIPLLTGVHYDETQFEHPTTFNPNIFLDENGKFNKHKAVMPFSAGKRICPGLNLAMTEIFLYVTLMLQNFTIKSLVHPEEISLAPVGVGLAHIPPTFQVCLIPRSSS